jgi:hypothetical protein
MKNKLLIIVGLLIYQSVFAQLKNNPLHQGRLEIKINKNIELLGLAYFIIFEGVDIETKTFEIEGKTLLKKEWHNYGFKIYQQYKSFITSKNLEKSLSVAEHLRIEYLAAFLLKVDNVPNATLSNAIKEKYYINFSKEKNIEEAKKNAKIFLSGLNAFSEEIKFDAYLANSKEYYDKVIEEVENGLPNYNFLEAMESFYRKKLEHYVLIPSLTIPKSMGFAFWNISEDEKESFNVFGALGFQEFENHKKLRMGFSNQQKLRELSVHEFGHSFVNPIVNRLPDNIFEQTEHLFEPLKSRMIEQDYINWKLCVHEHFVRAGEIIIADKIGKKNRAKKLLIEYQQERQFKYLPEIIIELKKYGKGEYQSYYETVKKVMKKLVEL